MKVTGIIAEYNPFHNGHAYHLNEARKRLKSDYVVVVMSGNYVQRGAPTILDKYSRAQMALSCGADLVLELPACFATASAEYFAYGGVSILNKLGVVDALCFGTETLDSKKDLQDDEDGKAFDYSEDVQELLANDFMTIAKLLNDEPSEYLDVFRTEMKNGASYAAARSKAIAGTIGQKYADIIDTSNNILAVEYLRAILKLGSKIEIEPIPRMLASHHDTMITEGFSSATAIRNAIFNKYDFNSIAATVPKDAFDILMDAYLETFPIFRDDFSVIVGEKLLAAKSADDLAQYFGINNDLANRLFNYRNDFVSFSQFRELISTKNSNKATVSRAMMHLALQTTKTDMDRYLKQEEIKAVKVLGFRKEAEALLSEIKKKGDILLVTKLADYTPEKPEEDMITETTRADMLYRLVARNKFNTENVKTPYEQEIIVV